MTTYHDPRSLDEAMREIRDLRDASRKHNIVVKERNELRAKLAALELQEPVGHVTDGNGHVEWYGYKPPPSQSDIFLAAGCNCLDAAIDADMKEAKHV